MNAAKWFGIAAAALIVGWPLTVAAGVAIVLAADAHIDRKYRAHPNLPPEPKALDDTDEFTWLWESPQWLRLPGDEAS